jgi:uncharacterized membrane protein
MDKRAKTTRHTVTTQWTNEQRPADKQWQHNGQKNKGNQTNSDITMDKRTKTTRPLCFHCVSGCLCSFVLCIVIVCLVVFVLLSTVLSLCVWLSLFFCPLCFHCVSGCLCSFVHCVFTVCLVVFVIFSYVCSLCVWLSLFCCSMCLHCLSGTFYSFVHCVVKRTKTTRKTVTTQCTKEERPPEKQ